MGRTYKIIVCGKKAIGKSAILEQLIYSNSITNNSPPFNSLQTPQRLANSTNDRYFSTIEDIYVACWEKDKGIREKLRFYDTKGMESSKDTETINQMRHLFSSLDGAVLIFSSNDSDSFQCIEKIKFEIEKSKDKKEICHFIVIDYTAPTPMNQFLLSDSSREALKLESQNKLRSNFYELNTLDKRDLLCKPFIDLASNITQINTKSSMNSLVQLKKPKVFSSNK
jgi:NF-kappa-B inhibitor-interacting Ras-like protein